MATAKPRYQPQVGEQINDSEFSDSQLSFLKSVKDDDSFIEGIRHISTLYGTLKRSRQDELSAGEIKATLEDLERKVRELSENLNSLPHEVDLALWKFSYRVDAPGRMVDLKNLLGSLASELENIVEGYGGRAGRKTNVANQYAADALRACFTTFGLSTSVNSWEGSKESPIVECLRLIFSLHGTCLSRSGMEEYLK